MIQLKLRLTGGPRVAAYLKVLGPKLARGPLRRGVTKASRVIAKRVKDEAPVETDTLRRATGQKVKAFRKGLGYYGVIGARKDAKSKPGQPRPRTRFARFVARPSRGPNPAWQVPHKYAHLVEGGTRPHAVGKGSSLRKGVQIPPFHPGARKDPFMTRSHAAAGPAALAAVAAELRAAVRAKHWWWNLLP